MLEPCPHDTQIDESGKRKNQHLEESEKRYIYMYIDFGHIMEFG